MTTFKEMVDTAVRVHLERLRGQIEAQCRTHDHVVPVGLYGIRCCAEGDWFVYLGDQMLFATDAKGFDTFDQAWDAMLEHSRAEFGVPT